MPTESGKSANEFPEITISEADVADTAPDMLVRVSTGDRLAFESLYEMYSGILYAICKRILRDENEACEVLSEVFLEIWQRARQFSRERGTPESFLFSIARSRSIDRLRKRVGRHASAQTVVSAADFESTFSNQHSDPLQSLVKSEEVELVRSALLDLEPLQRHILEAAYFEGLSHSQISSRLCLPLGTVKTSIRRAIQFLRLAIRDET